MDPFLPKPDEAAARFEAARGYEVALSRLLIAFIFTGLAFLVGPGSLLGFANLLAISRHEAAHAVTAAWLQAHGHAEIYGWVGSFILGIGFHSLTRQHNTRIALPRAWACWAMWTAGVGLRWSASVYAWHWRVLLPLAGGLELAAFLIFFTTVRSAHRRQPGERRAPMPGWILLVFTGALGFLLTLLLNAAADICLAGWGAAPMDTPRFDAMLVAVMTWAFLVPFVLGFSTRWFPIFAGLRPAPDRAPRTLALLVGAGAVATIAQAAVLAAALWLALALAAVAALGVARPARQPAKTQGIHRSFPWFLRGAYGWLVVAGALGLWAALDHAASGAGGAARHALTVGFIAGMVLTIGPRILPAFSGMRTLFSPALMLWTLALLELGCLLRVSGELLAYPNWAPLAWTWLPWSAAIEVTAFVLFAINIAATLLRAPEHVRRRSC